MPVRAAKSGSLGWQRASLIAITYAYFLIFAPTNYQGTIAPTGDSTIQVSGIFTLHGASHSLTVPMQIHIEAANLTAKGEFTVPYVKWGLKDPSYSS